MKEIVKILEDHLEWLHGNEIIFKSEIGLIATRIASLDSEITEGGIERIISEWVNKWGITIGDKQGDDLTKAILSKFKEE